MLAVLYLGICGMSLVCGWFVPDEVVCQGEHAGAPGACGRKEVSFLLRDAG